MADSLSEVNALGEDGVAPFHPAWFGVYDDVGPGDGYVIDVHAVEM